MGLGEWDLWLVVLLHGESHGDKQQQLQSVRDVEFASDNLQVRYLTFFLF